jgi:hypothetical protein
MIIDRRESLELSDIVEGQHAFLMNEYSRPKLETHKKVKAEVALLAILVLEVVIFVAPYFILR